MSAPSSAYSSYGVYLGTPTGNTRNALALPLSAYSSRSAFLAAFFLDDAIVVKDIAGNNCLIGLTQQGTANDALHASGRLGKIRMTRGTATFRGWNDAGLNTLGTGRGSLHTLEWGCSITSLRFKS